MLNYSFRSLQTHLSKSLALGQVATSLSGEVVDVVERMHGSITQFPLPFGTLENEHTRGISSWVYKGVRSCFTGVEKSLAFSSQLLQSQQETNSESWVRFQAILNGVFGDQLDNKHSALAIKMQLLAKGKIALDATTDIIFIHGLCLSEHNWNTPAVEQFCEQQRLMQNANIYYIRYNTGLPIAQNGKQLSELLENTQNKLVLMGHSMGGLLIRSAIHAAEQAGHTWPSRLQKAAMLGSPHKGAPLERLGQYANELLTLSPYLKPLYQLGDLRSAGIQDLRYAKLTDDAPNKEQLPLSGNTHYLLVAASIDANSNEQNMLQASGDLLVTVDSALAMSKNPANQLNHLHLKRVFVAGINHLDLLADRKVYQVLGDWLTEK